jgi:hypothetical protein
VGVFMLLHLLRREHFKRRALLVLPFALRRDPK